MHTRQDFELYLSDLKYKNMQFYLGNDESRLYLQIRYDEVADPKTGEVRMRHGRKWFISPHMTKSEFIQTAFKAALTIEEHECRENFLYRGVSVFGPHFNIDDLYDLARTKPEDARTR